MTYPRIPRVRASHSRALITLVVDTSESIAQIGALGGLNHALREWGGLLRADTNLARIGQIAMVTFGYGGVRTVDGSGGTTAEPADPFVDVTRFNPADLRADGYSPMLEGIER